MIGKPARRIERVVLALDAVSENRPAIEAAVRLAARWHARVHAVFVEDDDLLRLADLPFVRHFSFGRGFEAVSLAEAEGHLRAFAEHARRELSSAARRHGVDWSFDIVRGTAGAAIVGASPTDFFVAGTATRPIGWHFRIEHRWWPATNPEATGFLLAVRTWEPRGTVVALINGQDESAERLLDTAAQVATADGRRLVVICPAALAEGEAFGTWLGGRVSQYPGPVEIDLLPGEPPGLVRRLLQLDCRLVALTSADARAQPPALRALAAEAGCDVLVVR